MWTLQQISALVMGEMRRQHARLTKILETFPWVFYFSKLLINEKRGNCNKAPLPSRISILLINFVLSVTFYLIFRLFQSSAFNVQVEVNKVFYH